MTRRALIDCEAKSIYLSKVTPGTELPSYNRVPFRATSNTRIPPFTAALIQLTADLPDSDYLLEPNLEVFFQKGLALPFALTRSSACTSTVLLANTTNICQILPAGSCVATTTLHDVIYVTAVSETCLTSTSPLIPNPMDAHKLLRHTINANLPDPQRDDLHKLLCSFLDIFDFQSTPLTQTSAVQHTIATGDHRPLRSRPYRVSASEREVIQNHVSDMLRKNIIQDSSSPWSSPVVLVKKKDNTWRFCVDYRRLNKITKKDVYPLPRIDDALDSLHNANYFSSIDMRSGYWQISVDEKDREKTAFVTPDGLYEFRVMPFGLCNAPATFERMMDSLLRGLRWTTCLCYLDDVIIFSSTFDEHLSRLTAVLKIFRDARLQLNSKKCVFGNTEIKILGHVVRRQGISPDPEKLTAVSQFPPPTNQKALRSFLGLCSYFRRFIRGFAEISAPLHHLLKKGVPFKWSECQQRAFHTLKTALTTQPVLAHFNPSLEVEIHTDASSYGLGAVLIQKHEDKEHVVAYASRALSKPELNYPITEKECLAIIWAIAKFRPYVFGRHFKVITDHHALCWLTNLKDPSGKLGRWALKLQEYDISIFYKSGKKHQAPDCLSRNPVSSDPSLSFPPLNVIALTSSLDFASEQQRDKSLRQVFQCLKKCPQTRNEKRLTNIYKMECGILYRRNYDPQGAALLYVVPKHLRGDILRSLHDDPTAGHMGFFKTYMRVRHTFYWQGMYRDIFKYVASCLQCQRRKRPTTAPAGQLHPLNPPHYPFERVGIDLLGPLPLTKSGNRWVIVAIDHLSRYAETSPLPTANAEDVATFLLRQVFLRHGPPRHLISDRGTVFLSAVIQQLLGLCGTVHRPTTAYHPQTNGLVERFNRTIADMISMYVQSDHQNWDSVLPFVTYAYNTALQDTHGYSPFFLLHNRSPTTLLDTLLPYNHKQQLEDTVARLVCRAEEARQLARLRTMASQQRQCQRYNETHRQASYTVGDLVWLWTPRRQQGKATKFLHRYVGPYRITAKLSDLTYQVQLLHPTTDQRTPSKDTVHITRIKPYRAPPSP